MKNAKLGLFALLGLVGVASAFTNAPNRLGGTTYYAVTDGALSYTWSTTAPPLEACNTPRAGSKIPNACTVQTVGGFTPTAGTAIPTNKVFSETNTSRLYR